MKLPNLDDDYYDTEGDILYLEKLLNEDPSPNLPPGKTKYLKQVNATMTKPSIEEPPKLELKEIPSHLEYAFLEGTNKLPVIISKELKDEEKSTLLKVLKSHKRAIVWKISDIKGIDPYFCTHKILMEDDFKPAVQHQRRVNPKIHEVIEKEVIKLFDAELIYLISDSPWVSLVYCVPKKGGMTVIETKDNELIPTRRCVHGQKAIDNLTACHNRPTGGHYSANFIAKKSLIPVFIGRLFTEMLMTWSHGVMLVNVKAKSHNIMKCLKNAIQVCDIFNVWGIDFMGPFLSSRGNKYILVAVDYFSKWVKAKALLTNDAQVVVKFLKSLFARFGTPRAIISDRGTHFCNDQFAKVMLNYRVTH
uniref:Reverse transcriptase domain-containing protein n=1 Tax=Tanacetum cinerariifolium TaxID=118510 RepID=A0A699II13_TANCI|nr:reverse transcriptase domain-containing protein [Tanacetum cinerariifolium]